MTFSIVARTTGTDPDGGVHHVFGVAVASKFLAVGVAVPAADPDLGAIATQAAANLAYRPQGLAMLRTGVAAADVIAGVTAADPQRDSRQLGVIGASGPGATFTGADCMDWAGGVTGPDFAIQGNILAGPQVVEAMRDAYRSTDADRPLAERLLAALRAGDEAGGDSRGRQSAALLVARQGAGYGGSDVAVDLRVDDHPAPIGELQRLLELHTLYFGRPDPATLLELTGELAAEVAARLSRLGYTAQPLERALADWAGVQNFEERLVPGRLDPLVLQQLRAVEGAEVDR